MKNNYKITASLLKYLFLSLFFSLPLPDAQQLFAQSMPDSQWRFGNSSSWIDFRQGTGILGNGQLTPYSSTGSIVATDSRTGELLFYTDGEQLIDETNTVISNELGGNISLKQCVHALPIDESSYGIIVITASNTLNAFQYNTETKELTVIEQDRSFLSNGTVSIGLESIRFSLGTRYGYRLLVPLYDLASNTAAIEVVSIESGILGTSLLNFPNSPADEALPEGEITALAFNVETRQLAIGQENTEEGIPLYLYTLADDANLTPTFLADAGENFTSLDGDISSLAWKDGYLFASRTATTTLGSGIYRLVYDEVNNLVTPQIRVDQSLGLIHHDLRTGPDGRVYHLYQTRSNGDFQVGYVQSPLTDNATLIPNIFNTNFAGTRFSRPAPPLYQNLTVNFRYTTACVNNPVYLYPEFDTDPGETPDVEPLGLPDRVEWLANGSIFSENMLPVIPADQVQAGLRVELLAYYPSGVATSTAVPITAGEEVQYSIKDDEGQEVQQEVVLCPGESKELTLEITQGNCTNDPPSDGIWYKPESVTTNSKAQVEQIESITIEAIPKIEIDQLTNEEFISYPEAGTYYVLVPNSCGCEVYRSFTVVVRDDESTKLNKWYFGDGAGIDFTQGSAPIEADENQMRSPNLAPEGTAMAVDENIFPLFYTNGDKLWVPGIDASGMPTADIIAEGTSSESLKGDVNADQNSIFKRVAPDPTLYYLFTIGESPERFLHYSVADLKGNTNTDPASANLDPADLEQTADLGQPTADRYVRAIPLLPNIAEKIAGGEQASSTGWVVTHELNTNRFITFNANAEGLSMPIYSNAGSAFTNADAGGYMIFSPDLSRIASILPDRGVEIVHFDNSEGIATDSSSVFIPANRIGGNGLYGLVFASDDILLISHNKAGGGIYGIRVSDSLSTEEVLNTIQQVEIDDNAVLGAMQRGPNGTIYVARQGEDNVATISASYNEENDNLILTYTAQGLSAPFEGGATSELGLPNLIEQSSTPARDPYINVTAGCVGEQENFIVNLRARYDIEDYRVTLYRAAEYVTTPNATEKPQGFIIESNGGNFTSLGEDGLEVSATFGELFGATDLLVGSYVAILELASCEDYTTDIIYPYYSSTSEPIEARFTISGSPEVLLTDAEGNALDNDPEINNPFRFVIELCNGETTSAIANLIEGGNNEGYLPEDFTYVWSRQLFNASTIVSQGNILENAKSGVYSLLVTNTVSGCEQEYILSVIDNRPQISLPEDEAFCQDEENLPTTINVTVTPSSGSGAAIEAVNWYLSVNGSNFNEIEDIDDGDYDLQTDTLANSTILGIYSFAATVIDGNGCFISDTLTYTLGIPPVVELAAGNLQCTTEIEDATLTATVTRYLNTQPNAYEYTLYRNGVAVLTQNDNVFSVNEAGSYTVEVLDKTTNCVSEASNEVTIVAGEVLPDVTIEDLGAVCELTTTSLQANIAYAGTDAKFIWSIQNDDGTFRVYDQESRRTLGPIYPGTYRVEVSISNAACGTQTKISDPYTVKAVNYGGNISSVYTICPESEEPDQRFTTATIRNLPEDHGFNIEWRMQPSNMLVGVDESFIITGLGSYTLTIENCPPIPFNVIKNCTPTLIFPNVINPASFVTENQGFRILNNGIIDDIAEGSFEVLIYNRWGDVIYRKNTPDFEWKGETNISGNGAIPGTYAYLVRYKNKYGNTEELNVQRGGVTVLR